jgi:beta-galactosidase
LKGSTIKAFNGKCLAVIQAGEKTGTLNFTAKADGLKEAGIKLTIK